MTDMAPYVSLQDQRRMNVPLFPPSQLAVGRRLEPILARQSFNIAESHAVQRMFERAISPAAVRIALEIGEAIADYPADTPYPSMLILAYVAGRPLQVVVARDAKTKHCYVVTAYVPDPAVWGNDFKTRKPR
jgi:hypothetical protein